jgi:hypothetical protein
LAENQYQFSINPETGYIAANEAAFEAEARRLRRPQQTRKTLFFLALYGFSATITFAESAAYEGRHCGKQDRPNGQYGIIVHPGWVDVTRSLFAECEAKTGNFRFQDHV